MSPLERAIAAGAVVLISGLFGLLLRGVLLPRLARLSEWTTWTGDEREFGDNFLIKHEFIKALARRFADGGIVIPHPIRAINTTQEMPHSAEARE